MATRPKPHYTPEEYLTLERKATYKSEYVDGEIFAMAGGSREHIRITLNISRRLDELLETKSCEVYPTEMRVRILRRRYYYPDVVVVCGDAHYEDAEFDTLLNPTVIFEVLSKTTEDYDKGEKADFYRALPSLQDLVFVSQKTYHVQHYNRRSSNDWFMMQYHQLEDILILNSIGCQLTLAEIYRRLQLKIEPKE